MWKTWEKAVDGEKEEENKTNERNRPNVYPTAGPFVGTQKNYLALQDSHCRRSEIPTISVKRDRTEGSGITLCQLSLSFKFNF